MAAVYVVYRRLYLEDFRGFLESPGDTYPGNAWRIRFCCLRYQPPRHACALEYLCGIGFYMEFGRILANASLPGLLESAFYSYHRVSVGVFG